MIRDILSGIFSPYSSFGEKSLLMFLVLLMIVALGMLVWLIFILIDLIDSVGITPTKSVITTVKAKWVDTAYDSFILIGGMIFQQDNQKSYQLQFSIDGEEIDYEVDKKFFKNIRVGDRIEVNYGFGRLSNSLQPTQISLVGR